MISNGVSNGDAVAMACVLALKRVSAVSASSKCAPMRERGVTSTLASVRSARDNAVTGVQRVYLADDGSRSTPSMRSANEQTHP